MISLTPAWQAIAHRACYNHCAKASCRTPRPRTTPSPEETSVPWAIHGVILWADMIAGPRRGRGDALLFAQMLQPRHDAAPAVRCCCRSQTCARVLGPSDTVHATTTPRRCACRPMLLSVTGLCPRSRHSRAARHRHQHEQSLTAWSGAISPSLSGAKSSMRKPLRPTVVW